MSREDVLRDANEAIGMDIFSVVAANEGASPDGTHYGTHPPESASPQAEKEASLLSASLRPPVRGDALRTDVPASSEREDSTSVPDGDAPAFVFETAESFAVVDEASAEMLLGYDDDDAVAVAGGTVVVFGAGGAGKTTAMLDAILHMATGSNWLGLKVARPCRVLVVENDGPRGRFRRKVRAKLAAWDGEQPGDRLVVLKSPWGSTSLACRDHREKLAEFIRDRKVDVLLAGPIVSLGMIGGGTPDEVSAFEKHLAELRELVGQQPLAVWLIHHQNVRGQISGAWDRVPDTLIRLVAAGNGHTRLFWQKARDCSTLHGVTWKLKWADGMSFEVDDTPDATEADIEEAILAFVAANPGCSWGDADKAVTGKSTTKRAVRTRLIAAGALVDRGTGSGNSKPFLLYVRDDPEVEFEDEQTTLAETQHYDDTKR